MRREAIAAPDSMTVGVPATVRVTTYHGDTCVRTAGTEVVIGDLVATIRPFNFIGRGMPCGASMTDVVHETELTFHRAGVATIRVERGTNPPSERSVVVRPRPRS